jgi:hypothetical protein
MKRQQREAKEEEGSVKRRCVICQNHLGSHHHKVKEQHLPILQEHHVQSQERKEKLKVGAKVCCRHYLPHGHEKGRYEQLEVLTEMCVGQNLIQDAERNVIPPQWPSQKAILKEIASFSNPKKKKNGDLALRQIEEEEALLLKTYSSIRQPRASEDQFVILKELLEREKVTLDLVINELYFIDWKNLSVEGEQVRDVIFSLINLLKEGKKLTYMAFKLGHRKDLYFWTGFHSCAAFEEKLLHPLYNYLKNSPLLKDQRLLPKSKTLLMDRVLWLMIFMWTDISFAQLQAELEQTMSIQKKSKEGFNQLMRNTAHFLAGALQDEIKLPSIEEWSSKNTGVNMDQYNQKKMLIMILDGTSLNIFKPSLYSANRGMYVSYKKHTAHRYFVVTLTNGEIIYVSNLFHGSTNDADMYAKSNLKALLEEKYGDLHEGWQLFLGGDKGYVFIEPPKGWGIILTKSAEKEKEGSDQTRIPDEGDPILIHPFHRIMDTLFAKPRSTIERTIGLMKRWKKLCGGNIYFNQGDQFLHDMVVISACLTNMTIRCTQNEKDEEGATTKEDEETEMEVDDES